MNTTEPGSRRSKPKTPRQLGNTAADETRREVGKAYNIRLAGGKHAEVQFTVIYGAHAPDKGRGNSYRGARCDMTIIDRDGIEHKYDGHSWLVPGKFTTMRELLSFNKLRRRGERLALHEAMRKAASLFGLVPPTRKDYPNEQGFRQAMHEWRLAYHTTIALWKNAKAEIWAGILSHDRVPRIKETIARRLPVVTVPPPETTEQAKEQTTAQPTPTATARGKRAVLADLCQQFIQRHGPLNIGELAEYARLAGTQFAGNPRDAIRDAIRNAPSVFRRQSSVKPYRYGLTPEVVDAAPPVGGRRGPRTHKAQ